MKRFLIPLLIFVLLMSCEDSKDDSEKGQLLFYTNSALINCPFKIELSLNGNKIGSVDASSIFSDTNCNCEDSGIGLLLNLKEGTFNYSANEIVCTATNRINSWTGTVNVTKDSCTVVFLNIYP
jgi:hypothetical protein